MFTLQKDNVVKLTDSEVKRDRYIAAGYQLVEDKPESAQADKAEDKPEEGQPESDKAEEKPAKKKA